jgi:hypothetical protein
LGQLIDGVMSRYCEYEIRATYTACTDICTGRKGVMCESSSRQEPMYEEQMVCNELSVFVFLLLFPIFFYMY